MKTSTLPLGLLSLCLASIQSLGAGALPEPTVAEIGAHHRVMQRTFSEALPNGRVRTRTTSYTELAVGMNYWKDGAYQPSREEIELFQDGAVFRQAQIQAIFAPNIATPAAIDLQTPSGRFQSHVLGLSIFNSATGQSEMVADVKDCIGELHPPNVIIYPDAFTDVRAAVRYIAKRDRFEQDIIIFERIPLPPGWDPAACRLEVWTEMVTAPTPVKTTRQINNLSDETLDFGGGSQRIGSGRAFMLEDPQGNTWSASMAKTWITTQPELRTFLVEAIEWSAVAQQLDTLPAPQQGAALERNDPARQMAKNAAGQRIFPRRQQAAKAGKIQMAVIEEKGSKVATNAAVNSSSPRNRQFAIANRQSPALVLDYSVVTTTNGFTFKGDTTYFVSGNCTLTGTNILEGGTVIKSTNGVTLTFSGPIDCRTGPYSPAIFTSWCDDTVGEGITGSTGNPWTNYPATAALEISYAGSDVKNIRVSHASTAIKFGATGAQTASHVQLVHCQRGVYLKNTTFTGRNLLMIDVLTNVATEPSSYGSTVRGEHLTLCRADRNADVGSGSELTQYFTNCLLVAVTNFTPYNGYYYQHCCGNASSSDPALVFQTVGAGTAYLLNNTYRNVGITNIDPGLRAELRKRTTYPPVELNSWITTDVTLSPQAQRDTDLPDLGWHYAPLDYVAGGVPITNATLTLSAGTALGCRHSSVGYSLGLLCGAQLKSIGSPDNLNGIVRYNTVQEQANNNWIGFKPSVISSWLTGNPAMGLFRFTEWSVPATDAFHFEGHSQNDGTYDFADCQFRGGWFTSDKPIVNVTNCLFHRVNTPFSDDFGERTNLRPTFRSCLFRGGRLDIDHTATADAWTFKDNLFDQTAITTNGGFTANYNAYTTNITNCVRLPPLGANDVLLSSSPSYEAAPLGRFYLPTNSVLINVGSTYATNVGLHQFTTTTNQVVETNTILDISFHWIGLNSPFSTGVPFDADGDGYADWEEDKNGNGTYDAASGETDWKTYNSKLGIGTNGPGLITFTPLK